MRLSWFDRRARLGVLVLIIGCQKPAVTNPGVGPGGTPGSAGNNGAGAAGGDAGNPGGGGGGIGGATGGAGGVRDAGFGFVVPDARATDVAPAGDVAACAEESTQAKQVPIDLLLLVDSSSSMASLAGTRSKWSMAVEALQLFVRDPKSAGIGMGLQFFPHPPVPKECRVDMDCPPGGILGTPSTCQDQTFCVGSTTIPPSLAYRCNITGPQPRCPGNGMCVRGGLCSMSKRDCAQTGMPCPGSPMGMNDVCMPVASGRVCGNRGGDSCELPDYERLIVPIAALPGNEMMMNGALTARMTAGTTPTAPAVQGALAHLRKHQMANPDRRVGLVLTTDGFPTSCSPTTPDGIAAFIRMAQMATPPINTYVIGVFSMAELMRARMTLDVWATAGGTGMPFVITAGDDLSARLQDALAQIRGSALPCEFMIPPARGGGKLDYGKVNLKFRGAMIPEEIVPYVERADRCDPMRGGWYYDVHPSMGTPTRVIACEASCRRFKADTMASVSLSVGCATEVIQ